MEQKHSPLPWKNETPNHGSRQHIYDAGGDLVACGYGSCDTKSPMYDDQSVENSTLIVRAVNSTPAFDALIEAAGKTLEKVSPKDAGMIGVDLCRALSQLGATLIEAKKARGI